MVFSDHAMLKMELLKKHGVAIDMRKIRYSKDVDILLIELSDKPIDYAEEEDQIIVHFSKEGEPVLIEIMDAKEFVLKSISSIIREKEISLP